MTGDGVNDAPALKKADIGIAVEGATEAAKAAADMVLLSPGLSVIITGIIRSRKIFQRMKNYCIYRITCTVNLLLFFSISIVAIDFSIPTLCLVILVILNDGTIMTISHDKVIPSKKPEKWKLLIVTAIAAIVGCLATLALFLMYILYSTNVASGHNVFGFPFNSTCYFSQGPFPEANIDTIVAVPQCNPVCPGFDPTDLDCGDWVGFSELITVIYHCLSVGGQLTVFVARTKHSFWSRRPGYTLLTACVFAQVCATFLSVYWPLSFKISAYIGLPTGKDGANVPHNITMHGIGWKMAAFVWVYCLIWFMIEDLVKVYFYYSLDNDNKPDVDVQKIKKDRKPFMPNIEGVTQGKKKKDYESKQKLDTKQLVSLP